MRLDEPESAFAELDSGSRAIVAGRPAESELLARVTSSDDAMRMPLEGDPLMASEIAILKDWISAGAEWKKHWAFIPPEHHEPPAVKDPAWVTQSD